MKSPRPHGFVPWRTERRDSPGWVANERGCHVWLGARNEHGYAVAKVGGRMLRVHRVRYEREIGPIPDGLDLDHFECDNGAGGCCNPRHCRPATRRENLLRGDTIPSRCLAVTHCPAGHEYTEANTYRYPNGSHRQCRACMRAHEQTRIRHRAGRSKQKASV